MPRPKTQRNQIKYKYNKHEIVWAKIAGFPWWPASITCTPSKSNTCYKVDFIGDRSYAYLAESKIANYAEFRHQYQIDKKNCKNFANAVTIAARKYEQLLLKKECITKSKGSVECKTSYQKQQLNKQIQLPLIQEKIQQIDSQNQKDKNSKECPKPLQQKAANFIDKKIQDQKCQHNHSSIKEQNYFGIKQTIQNKSYSIEAQYIEVDKQQKQKLMQQILVKYKLHLIPEFIQSKNRQRQNSVNDKKKLHWKRKLIFKKKQSSVQQMNNQFGEEQFLARKIYKFLWRKLGSIEDCMRVSLSLKDQIIRQKINKAECVKKAVEWIQMSDCQSILNYHSQWINFYKDNERQKQKHSSITMEDQSQQLLIK